MSTDKHYNEAGAVPEVLEDHKGTDAQATKGIFLVIMIVGAILLGAVAVMYLFF